MGRPHKSKTGRRGRLASPAGRRGPRGRDRVVLPPRLRGARVSLGVCGGARDGAADAVRRTRTAGHPRPGDPPRQLPRPPRARAIRCRARGSDMSTVVMSVYKVARFSQSGGRFWVYLQYALGLRRLGCDVYWLEQLRPARDPERQSYVISTFLERMQQLGFEGRTLLYTLDGDPRFIGCTWGEAEAVLPRADGRLNFSYALHPPLLACPPRPARPALYPRALSIFRV